MYTAVRFCAIDASEQDLVTLGNRLNQVTPALFDGLDRVGGRFSISVCESDDWEQHSVEMLRFLATYEAHIREAQVLGIHVEFDTAIEPEDYEKTWLFTWDVDYNLIARLAELRIRLCFSLYYTGENDQDKVQEASDQKDGCAS